MNLESYLLSIQNHLIKTHQDVLAWFNESEEIKMYKPEDGGWSISEILEHIALTSHFLLILIEKGSEKAIRNINEVPIDELIESEELSLDKIDRIGMHKSFDWIRPEHMEPTGKKEDGEIIDQLVSQLNKCLNQLELLKNGEGFRYKTTMTVDGLGKINVYEYIQFLSKHAERHIRQMQENKEEFICKNLNLN
ncbi:MAG TPA: DinB family protein [Saprospiraceae bacterium]|nr:DinB family protein [Saprospiraceae bacterium]